jgi:membrane fusion protein, multidrug efflux system
MKIPNIKGALKKIKAFNFTAVPKNIVSYDYKGLATDIKKFNYKSLQAYKELFRDKVFQKRLIWCVIAFILFSMVKGCIFIPKKAPMPPRPVQTALVVQRDVPIYVESFGTLSPIQDVNMQAQITGRIQDVHFEDGNDVSIGDPLYTIDPSEYKAQMEKAQASLAQSIAEHKLKVDILERNKRLIERDLISKQDFESLQTDVVAAQAKVDLDKAELDLAKINLSYCYIISPLDGVASKGMLDPGNIVTADSGTVLVNIKTINTLHVDFTLSERELSAVRDAMARESLKVEIRPEGGKDSYDGRLIFIDNAVDNMTGTIFMRASVDNSERRLWPGQFVTVRLILSTQEGAVLAPYAAVKIGQKGHYLFIFTDENKADLRNIEIGLKQGDYVIVKDGVNPNEKAIISGILGLYPGATVMEAAKPELSKKTDKKK